LARIRLQRGSQWLRACCGVTSSCPPDTLNFGSVTVFIATVIANRLGVCSLPDICSHGVEVGITSKEPVENVCKID